MRFSRTIDDEKVAASVEGLKKLLPIDFEPFGKSFRDIGSGSGIHSLAAYRTGFSRIVASDYDVVAVETTRAVAQRYEAPVVAFQEDILSPARIEKFDVVYSWGVLHHTGDMAKAINNAARYVEDGGLFLIAIYLATQKCDWWKSIKRRYCEGSRVTKSLMLSTYLTLMALSQIKAGTFFGPASKERGMARFVGAVDWLGGYPYESATPEQVRELVGNEFELIAMFNTVPSDGRWSSGCGEYVFRKRYSSSRESIGPDQV